MISRNLSIFFSIGLLSFSFIGFSTTADAGPRPQKANVKGPLKINPRVQMLKEYNDGVDLMLASKHALAQTKFEVAIKFDPRFAEAHNNLAYVLRKQGVQNYKKALEHYKKAISLEPNMAEAYMYRGVLFVLMGDITNAKKDREKLAKLNPKLAAELTYVIKEGKEKTPAKFFGVSGKVQK